MKYKIALAQTKVCSNRAENIETAEKMIREAAEEGASLIVFPEVFLSTFPAGASKEQKLAAALSPDGDPVKQICHLAAEYSIWTVFGIYEHADERKNYNTTVVADADGRIAALYRKTHVFDAFSFRESDYILPGDRLFEPIETPFGKMGLMVCYEARFPEVARYETLHGADIIVMPTAWLDGPGKTEQLELLVRCRALENTVYLAMCDLTGEGRSGSSMVADPMGNIIVRAEKEPELLIAKIDTDREKEVRKTLPSLKNRRPDLYRTGDLGY